MVAALAGASPGRARGSGTGALPAMAKMAGRCRGKGIGPRIGSSAESASAAAMRGDGGAGGGGSRDAPKSGGLVVFGLGHGIPRSEEPTAPVEVRLSVDRGASRGAGGTAAALALPVDVSAVVLAADVTIAGEGACSAGSCSEAALDGLFAVAGDGRVSTGAAGLGSAAAEFGASAAEASVRDGAG